MTVALSLPDILSTVVVILGLIACGLIIYTMFSKNPITNKKIGLIITIIGIVITMIGLIELAFTSLNWR